MSDLVVRAYNVGFGDAVLVTVPEATDDGEVERHLLIDVGNVLAGDAAVFEGVVRDIHERTGGRVDLYVMTHEHLDHTKGLLEAADRGVHLAADWAWLTRSAAPGYYDEFPEAREKRLALLGLYLDALALQAAEPDPLTAFLLENNSAVLGAAGRGRRRKTAAYVDHIRTIAPPEHVTYVARQTDVAGRHPFTEATLRVLAPEEDTSDYYGRYVPPRAFGATAAPASAARSTAPTPAPAALVPPPGVDSGAFFDLLRSRDEGIRQGLFEIDRAANNTSLVLEVAWRGWVLLFAGDAEVRSWQTMADQGLLGPVHLVKVSHHGSHNGTRDEALAVLLPDPVDPEGRARHAIVSTHDGDWASVPDGPTLAGYTARGTLHDTRDVDPGAAVEIRFPG